jgi:DUF35 OB-fold domain, acyl-CoA-associated
MIETIAASKCPRCDMVVAPPATYCPHHPVAMTPATLPGVGEVVSFTTLHTPPAGFRSPLHIAIVELRGGGRCVCHGAGTRGLKIGARVAIEAIDNIYYFSHLGAVERARLFWRRTGRAGDRVNAIARSLAKRVWNSPMVNRRP